MTIARHALQVVHKWRAITADGYAETAVREVRNGLGIQESAVCDERETATCLSDAPFHSPCDIQE